MKSYINSIIIASAIIITSLIFARAFQNRNKLNDTITVTGSGSKDFVSDLIVWRGSFEEKNINLKEAYLLLDKDRGNIKKYLSLKGIKENEIIFEAVSIDKEFRNLYSSDGRSIGVEFTGYRLSQTIQVESSEVDKVENVSREVTELINQGIQFNSYNPSYYYTKMAQLKLEMIAEATKDASERAKKIAENAGGNLGQLKNANLGVFQIIAQNSSEDYEYGGAFNTSSKRKTANITVKLTYETE